MSDDRGWMLACNELYGLDVTVAEARAILAGRPYPDLATGAVFRVHYRSDLVVSLSLRVTPGEAALINKGLDPLEVLLPRYRARPLTRGELLPRYRARPLTRGELLSLPAGWTLVVRWERTPAGPVPVSGQLGWPGGALALTGEQAIALWDGAALEDVLPDFTRGNG